MCVNDEVVHWMAMANALESFLYAKCVLVLGLVLVVSGVVVPSMLWYLVPSLALMLTSG